jgi:hypothetical protein
MNGSPETSAVTHVPHDDIAAFRKVYRENSAPSNTAMAIDIAITNVSVMTCMTYLVGGLHEVSALAWLTVPITFLYANLTEYLVHRYVMHNRSRWFFFAFKRHALEHHSFYTNRAMSWDRFIDSRLIFFPTLLQLSFIVLVVAPFVVGMDHWIGQNGGHLFGMTVLAYFLNYEWLHFVYHVDAASPLLRVPGTTWLRHLHEVHHDRSLMGKCNFNITYPIMDAIFRTLRE